MKKVLTAICIATAALASCATGSKTASLDSLGGEWTITKADGKDVKGEDGERAPFIGFDIDKKTVYGSTGCNRLTGALNADAASGRIDFGATGSTRMMCHDMETESLILGALGKVKTYKVKGTGLTLCDEKGNSVIEMKKK